MRKLAVAAFLVVVPAIAFAQMLPADVQSVDRDEGYNVNAANGVSADHTVRPHMIGDAKARSVRVGGRTYKLADDAPLAAIAVEPLSNGS